MKKINVLIKALHAEVLHLDKNIDDKISPGDAKIVARQISDNVKLIGELTEAKATFAKIKVAATDDPE